MSSRAAAEIASFVCRNLYMRFHVCVGWFIVLLLGMTRSGDASAGVAMPEGMKGWWHLGANGTTGFVRTPHEACLLSA